MPVFVSLLPAAQPLKRPSRLVPRAPARALRALPAPPQSQTPRPFFRLHRTLRPPDIRPPGRPVPSREGRSGTPQASKSLGENSSPGTLLNKPLLNTVYG
ncbi:hypothetical protein CENSYa_1450 [Cenarchaeum symbiosum A]|uniref:Uncharacterized protein n=1 Tax=Cenarchaeum symbiosum (strain A) TaxID=414004 RepID=A0RXK5_CENSY|nr:hypothetical protein CENSYa_1450 [Cenarchaeum symbiosum A]